MYAPLIRVERNVRGLFVGFLYSDTSTVLYSGTQRGYYHSIAIATHVLHFTSVTDALYPPHHVTYHVTYHVTLLVT